MSLTGDRRPPGGRRRWGKGRGAAIVGLLLVLSGCGVQGLNFATPPVTSPSPTTSTTVPSNYTGVTQDKVSGRTTIPQVAIGPGKASLTGTVVGPGGPVAGATVEVDRIVGTSMATKQVTTAADGSWSIPRILGGRYRARAWQTPTLAMTTPQIFFLGGSQSMAVNLQVQTFAGQSITSAANPESTDVGGAIEVVVSVSTQSVDQDGIVSYQPASGVSVDLTGGGNVTFANDPVITDATGEADFIMTCVTAGGAGVIGTTPTGASTSLPSLQCNAPFVPPATTTTIPSSTTSSTSVPTSSSTTTKGGGLFP